MGAEGLPLTVHGELLRSRRTQALLAALIPVLGVAVSALLSAVASPVFIAFMPLVLIGTIFAAVVRAMANRPVLHRGKLELRDGEVLLGSRRLARRDAITSGVVVPGEIEGTLVRLQCRRGQPIDLVFDNMETAHRAVETIELDAAHAVARFPVRAPNITVWRQRMTLVIASAAVMALGPLLTVSTRSPLFLVLLLPLLFSALFVGVAHRLTVGTDGISMRRFGRETFISLDGIARASAGAGDTVMMTETATVRLYDAEGHVVHEILVDQKKQGPFSDRIHQTIDARARAIADRINEAIRLRKAEEEPFDRATLARGERDDVLWIRELRGLLSRGASFRDAGPPPVDALLAIVEDGSAEPTDRAAAAIAIAKKQPERVRVAAEATAAPKLRVALEAALEDDDEKLAAVLRDLAGGGG
jgi:hypothetical protein